MNPTNEKPDRELFLVLEGLTGQLDSLLDCLRLLSQAPEAGLLLGVDALYRADKDLALLCLRFDEALNAPQRRQLIRLACRGGVPVLDPLRLSESDKALFYQRHLRRYAVRIDDKKSPNSAIDALGQLLGLIELRAKSDSDATIPSDAAKTRVAGNRPGSDEKLVLEPHRNGALGSHSDVDAPKSDYQRARSEEISLELPSVDSDLMDLGPAGNSDQVRPGVLRPKVVGPKVAGPNVPSRSGKPAGKRQVSARLATIPARPSNAQSSEPPAMPAPVAPKPLTRTPRATSAPLGPTRASSQQEGLEVRFQRGDRWMPARLRNLTLKQVRIAASAAPPLGSQVRIALALGPLEVELIGVVVEVVNTESSVDGSTSFRINLGKIPSSERETLANLLRRAQSEGLSLSPPPARKNRRFAVSWPIAVVSEGLRFGAAALDVSEQGLFLATTNLIRARQVVFGIPLDTPEPTVQGRARVAREVTEEMAEQRSLNRGYGLHFETLSTNDLERYAKFLVRVRQRSQVHVLVAGSSKESVALAASFQSVGYAVTQASSVEQMQERRPLDEARPDVAVLDEGILGRNLRRQFEKSFEAHNVRMLHLRGQAPASARLALDRLMSV